MSRWIWLSLLLTLAAVAATASVFGPWFQQLPARVPVHWDLQGRPDGFVDRDGAWPFFCLVPGIMLMVLLLTWALPLVSPQKFEIDAFRGTWGLTMAMVSGLLLYLHLVILYYSFDRQPPGDPSLAIYTGILAFFSALGLMLGRVQPNFWMGVRTPWTLASPQVWQATHRLAARVFFCGGLLGLALVWSGLPPIWRLGAMLAVTMGVSLIPIVHSLVYYKWLQRRGLL